MVYQKISSIFIALLMLVLTLNQDTNPNYSYEDFEIQFGRAYTGSERQAHKSEFLKNYAEFLEKRKTNPNIQVNTFFDWNETQLEKFFNYKPQKSQAKPQPLRSSLAASSPPSSFDYRTLGKVSPVRDQGQCGACWSFSAAAVFESFLLIQQNKLYDLSQQYGIECEWHSYGCTGGYPHWALKLFNQTGIPLQSQYPNQKTSPYFKTNPNTPICEDTTGYVKVKNVTRIQLLQKVTDEFLINELLTYGPISIGIGGSHKSFRWVGSSGMVDDCPANSPIDHAVLLIGYTETHWIIKNSYGTWWGNNGFGYIKRSSDCGIKTYVSIFEAIYNPNTSNNTNNTNTNNTNTNNTNTNNTTNNNTTNNTNTNNTNTNNTNTNNTNTNNTNNTSNNTVPTNAIITIKMVSTTSNGWGGWILGFKQNGIITGNFTLWDGANGTKQVSLQPGAYAQAVVLQNGWGPTSTVIGFELLYSNGVSIYKRVPGQTIANNTIFTTFCPTSSCVAPVQAKFANTYQVELTNSWGNGYQGTVLQFRQGTKYIPVGEQFTTGKYFGPISLSLEEGQNVIVVPKKLGQFRDHIAFRVTDSNGKVLANWNSGNSFGADSILASFCPNCPAIEVSQQKSKLSKLQIGLISSLSILFVLALGLIVALLILCRRMKNKEINSYGDDGNQSAGRSGRNIVKKQQNVNGSSTVSISDRNI